MTCVEMMCVCSQLKSGLLVKHLSSLLLLILQPLGYTDVFLNQLVPLYVGTVVLFNWNTKMSYFITSKHSTVISKHSLVPCFIGFYLNASYYF